LHTLLALGSTVALVAFFSLVTLRTLWSLRPRLALGAAIALVTLLTRHTLWALWALRALLALETAIAPLTLVTRRTLRTLGARHALDTLRTLMPVPARERTYWVGEAMGSTNYLAQAIWQDGQSHQNVGPECRAECPNERSGQARSNRRFGPTVIE
jgi:hypothetical protein